MNDAMVEPAPGNIPMRNPTTDPFTKAKRHFFMSSQVGMRLRHPLGTGSISAGSAGSMLASTSPIAKTPIATMMKSIPPSSSTRPKVKRDVAVKRSVPMLAIQRPTSIARSAFTNDSPARRTTMVRPSTINAKYSGALNASESLASGGATSMSATTPKVPAMKEAIAAMPSAGPARPLRAIW